MFVKPVIYTVSRFFASTRLGRRTSTVWGDGAVLIISKNLPLKGKFFEMVSWVGLGGLGPPGISVTRAFPPGGGSGGLRPPGISVTRALPPQLDVRTVKNLKMSSKGRTDLKI